MEDSGLAAGISLFDGRPFYLDNQPKYVSTYFDGTSDNNYFTAAEYAGGYDEVNLIIADNANYVKVTLYYQGISREYIEFLRDEINGTANTLPWDPANDPNPDIVQTDPFFGQLKDWGNTIWDIWWHNHGLDGVGTPLDGIAPIAMTEAEWGTPLQSPCETPGTPQNFTATGGQGEGAWRFAHIPRKSVSLKFVSTIICHLSSVSCLLPFFL